MIEYFDYLEFDTEVFCHFAVLILSHVHHVQHLFLCENLLNLSESLIGILIGNNCPSEDT